MSLLSGRRALAILVLAAAAGAAACSSATGTPPAEPAASVPAGIVALPSEVSVAEANRLRDSGAFILDVRQPEEWDALHIPDATLIPLGELASRVSDVPRDRQVVVVCRSGNRSAEGRDILLRAGFPSVASMAGGMNDWAASGYATASGS